MFSTSMQMKAERLICTVFSIYSKKLIVIMFESLARLGDDPLFLGGFPMMEMEDEAAAR